MLNLVSGVSPNYQSLKEKSEKNERSAANRFGIISKLRKAVEKSLIPKIRCLLSFPGNNKNSKSKSKKAWANDDKEDEGNFNRIYLLATCARVLKLLPVLIFSFGGGNNVVIWRW